ncbi:hypothetical protein [Nostoc sp.]
MADCYTPELVEKDDGGRLIKKIVALEAVAKVALALGSCRNKAIKSMNQ